MASLPPILIPQYDEGESLDKFANKHLRCLRDIRQRLMLLEEAALSSGLVPVVALAGEEGVQAGHWLHLSGTDGQFYFASAAEVDKYATHLCTKTEGTLITGWAMGQWPCYVLTPDEDTLESTYLWLAAEAGYATTVPPEVGGDSLLKQFLGTRASAYDEVTGKVRVDVKCSDQYTELQ
jgi:hypothetical protein